MRKSPFSKEVGHKYHLASHYKISVEQEAALLVAFDNRCGICKEKFSEDNVPCIDHEKSCCPGVNSCGKCVRGVLCTRCNLLLGYAKEKPEILLEAASYLTMNSVPHPALETASPLVPNGAGRKFSESHKRNLSIAKQKAVADGTWINPKTGASI